MHKYVRMAVGVMAGYVIADPLLKGSIPDERQRQPARILAGVGFAYALDSMLAKKGK